MSRFYLLVLYFILFSAAVRSQDVTATLTADTNNVLIGEQIRLSIIVKTGYIKNISFPVFGDTIGSLDIVELFPVDTIQKNKQIISFRKDFIVTSFDSGSFEIPSLIISYESSDVNSGEIQTNSLNLVFSTIEVDTTGMNIRDIKPPIQVPFSLEDLIPYIIFVLGLFIVYYLLIVAFGRKKHKTIKAVPKYDPRIPADLEALEALQRLERDNLWQIGNYKLYHSKLTDILRVYIHRRYHLNALEMTSGELIDELSKYESNTSLDAIISILNTADLAKFAKYEPSGEENSMSMKNAMSFVNQTKVLDIGVEEINDNISGVEA